MNNKLKFYLHNSYEHSEIRDLIQEKLPNLSAAQVERAAEEIYTKFYEVAFDITLGESGEVKSVEFIE